MPALSGTLNTSEKRLSSPIASAPRLQKTDRSSTTYPQPGVEDLTYSKTGLIFTSEFGLILKSLTTTARAIAFPVFLTTYV